jgi:hypothetical protein
MSTPAAGSGAGKEHGGRGDESGDGTRRADTPDPTDPMDTRSSGAGASSAGRADTTSAAGSGSGDYVPGGYSADDDSSGDYVPGMYSDSPSAEDRTTVLPTPTREHTQPPPVSATRDAAPVREEPRTQEHTKVVPVTATKAHDDARGDRGPDRAVPRAAAAGGAAAGTTSGLPSLEDRKLLHQREKEHFGGMKFGSAFFGWLTATGLFVLLTALIGAVAALLGVGSNLSTADLTSGSAEVQSTGITAAVILGVVLFVSYFAGGYVAGRMARFSGIKQGIAVWLWAVIVAVVLTVIGFIAGNQAAVSDRFANVALPTQDLAGPGLIGLLVVAGVALLGAVLGGLTGMRYHRRIDRTDFDALEDAE